MLVWWTQIVVGGFQDSLVGRDGGIVGVNVGMVSYSVNNGGRGRFLFSNVSQPFVPQC